MKFARSFRLKNFYAYSMISFKFMEVSRGYEISADVVSLGLRLYDDLLSP